MVSAQLLKLRAQAEHLFGTVVAEDTVMGQVHLNEGPPEEGSPDATSEVEQEE